MSKHYVSNANGDWWEITEDGSGNPLYIISEDKLKEAGITDVLETDDIAGTIISFGNPVDFMKQDKFEEGVRYALEYLSDLYDGVMDTDLAKEYAKEEAN